jgi:EAL domain-containing protein (putative c-di-GMP-specific phosphodiesterase class I)
VLGLRVVAEGVEAAETLDELQLLGCTLAQGYVIARPMPAQQFTQWLLAQSAGTEPSLRLEAV